MRDNVCLTVFVYRVKGRRKLRQLIQIMESLEYQVQDLPVERVGSVPGQKLLSLIL